MRKLLEVASAAFATLLKECYWGLSKIIVCPHVARVTVHDLRCKYQNGSHSKIIDIIFNGVPSNTEVITVYCRDWRYGKYSRKYSWANNTFTVIQ